jgi:transposase
MAQKRAEVRMIREILRLHNECGYSDRKVSQICGKSRPTVKAIYSAVEQAGFFWPLPEELDDVDLERIVYPHKAYSREWPVPDWNYTWKQMQRKGVTLKLLWLRYKSEHTDGYQYSQYCENYSQWCAKKKVSMHLESKAGETTEVDYAGSTLPLTDRVTGKIAQVPVFVSSMGISCYLYAEASHTMQLSDWIDSHIRMFEFYGGSTEIIKPDNLKTGITRACKYEPELHRTYENMVRHYGGVIIPARPRKPKDKPRAEKAVQEILRWIMVDLQERDFFSLAEINEALWEKLEILNNKPMTNRDGSRLSLFVEFDKPLLKPLPATRFVFEEWKKVKVSIDYHVQIDNRYYSVPYQLCHHELLARYTSSTVELFNAEKRVATHFRAAKKWSYSTKIEHMPEQHAVHLQMTPEKIMAWASKIGEQATELAGTIIKRKEHPTQAYKAILGIMELEKKHGQKRLEAACGLALKMNSLHLQDIKMLLEAKKGHTLFDDIENEENDKPILHKNIRGGKNSTEKPEQVETRQEQESLKRQVMKKDKQSKK